MALLDLLGRRWALRVLWELRDGGAATFRELQARCDDASSSVLNERLRELAEAGIVAHQRHMGYRLTSDGQELIAALGPLEAWSRAWALRSGRRTPPRDLTG